MNDKDKTFFIKLILAAVIFVSFMTVLGLTACLIKNKKVANSQPQISASPEPTVSVKDENEDWQIYRNEEYGFEFKYPKEWNIIDNKIEGIQEGAPYVKLENKKDFKVRRFSIEIMLVNKEGAEMPAGMVFRESIKVIENKTTGEKMYFKIVANSCMGGICWQADHEEQAIKEGELFSKHWESIISSIKPLE